ncbi:MAG: hypothetical protein AVDCRST_MAG30-4269 [uncultured Solirubrobacteraceae bacterium]|uniref:DUF2029 domain-containing protein n=1 Tax=uncultured Solirubrobacteraceae bacterium TaxID=1162706 RepID=A0A6J4TZ54_9ACTN|nr:MAG: hypothetical protein AVDCRST_MAG30-4269 [uncultured Solirubrobacteraceae bacterium]
MSRAGVLALAFAVAALILAAAAGPAAAQTTAPGKIPPGAAKRSSTAITAPPSLNRPPPGYARTGLEVSRTAGRVAKIRAVRAGRRNTYARPYLKGPPRLRRWQVSFYAPSGRPGKVPEQIGQVLVDDRTGRAREAWTGIQVEWQMARGYPGAFGRAVNSPYLWIGLCVLFVLPFLRRPLRLLHLDLAVLLAFSVSYAFFGDARIGVSVPSVYPLLLYLLVRMLGIAWARSRGRAPAERPPLRLAVPYSLLALGIVFLVGLRVGLNVADGNVIDVGYAGVIGADRLLDGRELYGGFPSDNAQGDTYGPVNYYAYVPFEAVLPWSGSWDDLPAAHGAAIAFDLACLLLMFLVGRRIRGPGLGILLAYLWAAFPFTLLVANSNANDSLVAALVLLVLLAVARPAARGATLAAAALTKFAPLALAPLVATYRGGARAGEWGRERGIVRPVVVTALALAAAGVALLAPVILDGRLELFYDRTLRYQNERGSPFSLWGYYDLPVLQDVAKAAGAALAVVVAFVPRRRDVVVLAALGAAVLIALQMGVTHWFYLYLVWFFPLVMIALLAPHAEPDPPPRIL